MPDVTPIASCRIPQFQPREVYIARKLYLEPHSGRTLGEQRALYSILGVLSADSGKFTLSELGQVLGKNAQVTPEEYNNVISFLKGTGEIDVVGGLDRPRPRCHDHDLVGEHDRLIKVVSDEDDGRP